MSYTQATTVAGVVLVPLKGEGLQGFAVDMFTGVELEFGFGNFGSGWGPCSGPCSGSVSGSVGAVGW